MCKFGFICKQLQIVSFLMIFKISSCWGLDIELPQKISITDDNLINALTNLGKQTNTNILIVDKIDEDTNSITIDGTYSTRQTLDALLKNTNYLYKEISQRSVLIKKIIKSEKQNTLKNPHTTSNKTIEIVRVIGKSRTGSRIRKHQKDVISPLDVITAEQLNQSGTQSLGELLRFIPAVSGNSSNTAVSNGGDGTTKVALRGLPANNTLVLINNQRAVFDGLAGDSVDLNTVAPIAIEYLEIYKDGASAIYGSDAIAGVVNIRMLKEYNGTKIEHYSGITSKGDTYTRSINGLWGKTTETGSALLSASYFKQDGLFSRDRKLSESADARTQGGIDKRVSGTPYTSVTLADGNRVTLGNNRRDVILTDSYEKEGINHYRPAKEDDLFDFQTQTSTISPSTRLGLYSYAQKDINENLKLSSFAIYSHTKATITLASVPIYTAFLPEPITISQDNIYNPFGEEITDLRRRLIEFSPRGQLNDARSIYSNFGLEYSKNKILFNTNIYWNSTYAKEIRSNLVDGERLRKGLGPARDCQGAQIDGCIPINLFAAPGNISKSQLDFIRTTEKVNGSSRIYGLNTYYSAGKDWLDLTFDYAIGIDIRNEKSKLLPNDKKENNIIGSVVKTPTSGARKTYEVFSEIYLPILNDKNHGKVFDIELAMRYTKSTNADKNVSPKAGFRLSLTPEILLRGTYSRGFRAPSIKELNTEGIFEFSALDDPCAILSNVNKLPGCLQKSDATLNQFLVRYNGSEKLDPEVSENHILGIHIKPKMQENISFSVDAYTIDINNIINSNPQIIINENARSNAFSNLVDRDKNGNITLVKSPFVNIGSRKVKGADFNIGYQSSNNNLKMNFNASYIYSYHNKLSGLSEKEDLAGTFRDAADSGNGSIPHWKASYGINYSLKNWTINYALKYIGNMSEKFRKEENIIKRHIPSWSTHNIQIAFSPSYSRLYASLGIDNIADKSPPFIASAFNDNYDARTYDLKGRYIYATIGLEL